MDYKEKVIALLNSQELSKEQKEKLENIFPELKEKENEDERIRKELIQLISCMHDADPRKKGWITWLEKQGKSNTFKVPETSIKNAEEVASRMQHIKDDMKPIAEFIINYANWNLHKDEWNQPTLTVPLFRVLDALIQRGKPYGECVQNIEKQGEEVTNINGEDYGIDGLYHAINILEKTVGKVAGYQSDDGILSHKAAINAVKELYKKQGMIEPKTLDADKVIEWLNENVADFWANPCNPKNVINQFKKDFGL